MYKLKIEPVENGFIVHCHNGAHQLGVSKMWVFTDSLSLGKFVNEFYSGDILKQTVQ